MRTAVCISGLPREVSEVWRTWYYNLTCNFRDPDIFIYSGDHFPVDRDFWSTVKPKIYSVEPQKQLWQVEQLLDKIGYYAPEHKNSYAQQIYGLKKVWELKTFYEKTNDIKYDIVIRTRPDFIWLRPLRMEMLDFTKISTLHVNFAPTICTEFAVGPNDQMAYYFAIYDWLLKEGEKYLTRDNPRLNHCHDRLYNCDVILTTYFRDVLKLELANQQLPPESPSPYDYYRIAFRHFRNLY